MIYESASLINCILKEKLSVRMVEKVLQLVIALVWMTNSVHSCWCNILQHPQDQFCKSDYVFYGKVINENLVEGMGNDVHNNKAIWEYTFKVIFTMKGMIGGIGQDAVIETKGNQALCGVRFTVGKSYILMGAKKPDGTKTIALCDFRTQLINLTPDQTFYLFTKGIYSYKKNCGLGCKSSPTSVGCKYQSENDPVNTCLAKKALCQKEGTQCSWVNNGTC
ncbi:metalloproteinase inhibitor 3-like [Mytilus edulis]|uniref:metalloproteinase inhibitor 3-like n=1 Tax=Mytilus edulis TaxID=6550 RepID=UPI0039F0182D